MGQLILILLVCALLGCSAPTPALTIAAVDYDLNAPVALAVQRWHAATGLEFRRKPGGTWVERGPCANPDLLGCQGGRQIRVHPRVKGPQVEVVLVHEIGHALGAEHHYEQDNGIMRPTIGERTSCLTPADVAAVCARNACVWQLPECLGAAGRGVFAGPSLPPALEHAGLD